jgi:hypothetical protein
VREGDERGVSRALRKLPGSGRCGVVRAEQRTYTIVRTAFGIGAALALALGARGAACAQIVYGPGVLVARVRDAGNRPLAGAVVDVVGAVTRSATTTATGVVTIVGLPLGVYDVGVSRSGYAPYETRVTVTPATRDLQIVSPNLQLASFANPIASATRALPALGGALDPYAAHALESDRAANVVAAGGGAAVSLDGTAPYESRVELDGIPLAGGSDALAILRFGNALGLAGIDVTSGPNLATPDVRGAIGGTVNVRTPALDSAAALGVDYGYDSTLGNYEHGRVLRAFGPVALAFDGVTDDAGNRADSLKARYALSSAASLDFASYDQSGTGTVGTSSVTASAPAFAAGLRFELGGGTFQARQFSSALHAASSFSTVAAPNEDARTAGLQLGYDLPLGADRVSFAFERRTDDLALAPEPPVAQTFTSFSLLSKFAVARAVDLTAGDAYAGGTLLHERNDPQIELTYRAGTKVEVHLGAGGAFATAPEAFLALRNAASPALAPETAFGERLRVDARPNARDTFGLAVYDERRFATFGSLSGATDRGASVNYERAPATGLGGFASAAFVRSYAYGGAQPFFRIADSLGVAAGEQQPEIPYAKERVGITYRAPDGCVSQVSSTFLGANNAFAPHAVAIGDAVGCLQLFGLVDVRAGEHNLFGATVSDPVLAPLFVPHEYTLSVGLR